MTADLFGGSLPIDMAAQIREVERTIRMRERTCIRLKGRHLVILDLEDLWLLASENWRVKGGYVVRDVPGPRRRVIYFHREIVGAPDGLCVDHINGDSLDNRKVNLRLATIAQNSCNFPGKRGGTSRYKGVSYRKDRRKWVASVKSGSRIKHSLHETEGEAARAYDERALAMQGEFAWLNSQGWSQYPERQIAVMEAVRDTLAGIVATPTKAR